MSESLPIPDTLEACQQQLREARQAYAQLEREHQELLDTCTSIQEAQQKLRQENEEQQLTIQQLLHQLYGRRSERHKDARGQQHLDFGADETAELAADVAGLTPDEEIVVQYTRRRKQRAEQPRSEQLPEHLPRRTERIEPPLPDGVKPEDCQPIGIDVVEILRFQRPELWVQRLEYPKYKLPEAPASPILQAPRKVALIEGGRFGIDLATEIVFGKFVLHVPLYRQQDALAQLGWSPSRSTLCQIVATVGDLVVPLAVQLQLRVLASGVIASDDTPVTLLTPGVGKGSRQARFWIYRGIDEAPYNVFAFTDSRSREGPDRFLETFRGILLGDCYSGYPNSEQVTGGRIEFSACVAHGRRKVFLSREQCPALSSPLLALLGELYEIEDRGRLLSDAQRLVLRQQESVPAMARLRAVLDSELARGVLPKSKFGQALSYLRNHWAAFQVFLRDGRVAIDNNDAERELRRVAIGRKNWMFIGSQDAGERTAAILSVISSAHRHDLDEWAYLYDVLQQLARGTADLNSLLPDVWKAAHPDRVRTFRVDEKQQRAERRRYLRARRRLEQREAGSRA
ncbi:MAG: IS66 family transposase [Armatimonadetes bacterium]|nr:IS66 family transposase [Armatimonadota bacterium]